MNRLTKTAAVFFFLVCSVWYCNKAIFEVVPVLDRQSDFTPYYEASRDVRAGTSPYLTKGYIYPPLLACLLTPLASLPYTKARLIWSWISQFCLLGAAWAVWRRMGGHWIAAGLIAFVWAVGGAAPESLALGQLGCPLTLLLALAYTQREGRQAAAVGLGLALKLIPGVLGVVFVLRRRWRGFLILAGVSLTLLIVPWSYVLCCLDGPRTPAGTDTWTGTPAILSWSLPSVTLRVLDHPQAGALPYDWEFGNDLPNLHLPVSRRLASVSVAGGTLLVGIAILATALKFRVSPEQVPFAMAALTSLSLAASPVCWTHYQVMNYPGVALLLCHAWNSRRWKLFAGTLALGSLLYPVPVEILTLYYEKVGNWKLIPVPTLYIWTSVTALTCLAMFAVLLREAKRQLSYPATVTAVE